MRQKAFFIIVTLSTLVCIGCSDGGGSGTSANLDLDAMTQDGCLNLKKLTDHINGNFNFPARVTTLNFSSSRSSRSLDAANFGSIERTMTRFPFIRKAQQSNCQQVILETAYGRPLNYKIEASTERSLHLIREASAEVETYTDDVYKDSARAEPEIQELMIHLTSPSSAILEIKSDLFPSRCRGVNKVPYQKLLSVRWGGGFPAEEELDATYVERIHTLVSAPPETPGPPAAPTPTPGESTEGEHSGEDAPIVENPAEEPPAEEVPSEETPAEEVEDPIAEIVPPDPEPTPIERVVRTASFADEPAKTQVQVHHIKETHKRLLASFPGGQCP